jgi:hypothetical protein
VRLDAEAINAVTILKHVALKDAVMALIRHVARMYVVQVARLAAGQKDVVRPIQIAVLVNIVAAPEILVALVDARREAVRRVVRMVNILVEQDNLVVRTDVANMVLMRCVVRKEVVVQLGLIVAVRPVALAIKLVVQTDAAMVDPDRLVVQMALDAVELVSSAAPDFIVARLVTPAVREDVLLDLIKFAVPITFTPAVLERHAAQIHAVHTGKAQHVARVADVVLRVRRASWSTVNNFAWNPHLVLGIK